MEMKKLYIFFLFLHLHRNPLTPSLAECFPTFSLSPCDGENWRHLAFFCFYYYFPFWMQRSKSTVSEWTVLKQVMKTTTASWKSWNGVGIHISKTDSNWTANKKSAILPFLNVYYWSPQPPLLCFLHFEWWQIYCGHHGPISLQPSIPVSLPISQRESYAFFCSTFSVL